VLGLTLAVGLALGLGGAYLLFGRSDDGPTPGGLSTEGEPSAQQLDLPGAGAGTEAATAPEPPGSDELVEVEAATTPEAAVSGFLAAEALGDFERSYEFLSEADLVAYPTAAQWVAAHGDFFPVEGFDVEEVREDGTVVTLTALRSAADPVLGLIPARARGTWPTASEAGGVRVVFGEASYEALYPSDEGVAEAAATWVESARDCSSEGAYDGPLYGQRSLVEDLCGAEGEFTTGEVGPLQDGTPATPFLDAFGPSVFTWARAVPVRGPIPLTAVLAPIDDRWQVIGILPEGA